MQTYRIIPTKRSDRDLEEIAQYINQDSPFQAGQLVDQIVTQINSLQRMPQRFMQVGISRRRGTPVHRLIVDVYLIYYRVEASAVLVLTVRHGARRQLKRFD